MLHSSSIIYIACTQQNYLILIGQSSTINPKLYSIGVPITPRGASYFSVASKIDVSHPKSSEDEPLTSNMSPFPMVSGGCL